MRWFHWLETLWRGMGSRKPQWETMNVLVAGYQFENLLCPRCGSLMYTSRFPVLTLHDDEGLVYPIECKQGCRRFLGFIRSNEIRVDMFEGKVGERVAMLYEGRTQEGLRKELRDAKGAMR